jgi:ubiquinol-cytochrome c reductase cytochrome b subunit
MVRLPGGQYVEVHQQLDDYERWRLVDYLDYKPLMVRPDSRGRISPLQRVRAVLSRWFFEDRISPATRGELESGEGHH